MKKIKILDLGLTDYLEAKRLQDELVNKRLSDEIPDTLVLCEHEPVITIGRKGGEKDLLVSEKFLSQKKIKVYHVERGGEATYHCPGQLVGYPIFNLKYIAMDLHGFLRDLEEVMINTLKETGISAERREGYTGVWVQAPGGPAKIAFIGISARKWVTYHGFSLNIDCDLAPFKWIVPCGIKDAKVTSIKACQRVPPRKRWRAGIVSPTESEDSCGVLRTACQVKGIKEKIIENFEMVFNLK